MKRTAFVARALGLAAIAAFCASLAVSVPGCTILGLMAGAAADPGGTGGFDKLMSIPVGSRVTLTLWDKSTVTGRFTGWSLDSTDTLGDLPVAAVNSSITSPRLPEPAPGASVTTPRSGRPSMRDAYVHLDTKSGKVSVPAESIALVSVPSNGAVVVGFLAGLTLDVLVIRSMNRNNQPSSGCEGPDFPPNWPFGMARDSLAPVAAGDPGHGPASGAASPAPARGATP